MAVLEGRFLRYVEALVREDAGRPKEDTWQRDPVLARLLPELGLHGEASSFHLGGKEAASLAAGMDPVQAMTTLFSGAYVRADITAVTERRVVALKLGFPHLPATTARTVLQGFGTELKHEDVLDVFSSHGLSHAMRRVAVGRDFVEINRRAAGWSLATAEPDAERAQRIRMRFAAIGSWLKAGRGGKSRVLDKLPVARALFFHWWDCFRRLGLLGLADPGPELFRTSKVGPGLEARLVVDRLQYPERPDSFYVARLASQGVKIKRDAVAKLFTRWQVKSWNRSFTANLSRLETAGADMPATTAPAAAPPPPGPDRIEHKFLLLLEGWKEQAVPFSAPGLFTLWVYLEELGIVPELERLGLTEPHGRERYSWLELLMFDVARRFYGIATASAACEADVPELSWFARLYAPPCNDTLLDGLAGLSEAQAVRLRTWLVERLAQLGLSNGKRLAMDFHQIDVDVLWERLRDFGKGPSPKKKLCWAGFRPHLAWDVDNGTLVVAEFRKASARGTSTVRRFVSDYITPTFQGLFETVYIDSEYTGKDVWNFILTPEGMGAHLTACLRQNSLVKKLRDQFLTNHEGRPDFWCHYDDDHCFARDTFPIDWDCAAADGTIRKLHLTCVVKKNIHNGNLRCFGSSKPEAGARDILSDYSSRWVIENGIKDLVNSYFLDQCPGTRPQAVDVHFLITTICRTLYRMLERDIGGGLLNPDASVRTLGRMRDTLFRQGNATVGITGNALTVSFLNSFRPQHTVMLEKWFAKLAERHTSGLGILGGLTLKFRLQPSRGEEYRNSGQRTEFPTPRQGNSEGQISL